MWKKFVIVAVILVLTGAGVIYFYSQYDFRNKIVTETADFNVTATEIFAEYSENESAADEKYLGRVIQLTGQIAEINREEDQVSISLHTDDPLGQIVCQMNQSISYDWSTLEQNTPITIKGECSGKLIDVIIVNAVVEHEK